MKEWCQFFTPHWVAQALVERDFYYLGKDDLVIEPSCGWGAFLQALPSYVRAVGVEIDPALAARAAADSGRRVIVGDFHAVDLPKGVTAMVGNPPYLGTFIDQLVERAYDLLPMGGRAGFLLPTYLLRRADRIARWADRWRLESDMLPTSAFSGRMKEPLLWVRFLKGGPRLMAGFALYDEERDRLGMHRAYRALFSEQRRPTWREVCVLALSRLNGRAKLERIYMELERNRPSRTTWWREKIRQTLRHYPDFQAVAEGEYRLAPGAV